MGGKAAKERRRLLRLGMESTAKEESSRPRYDAGPAQHKNERKAPRAHGEPQTRRIKNEGMTTLRPTAAGVSSNRLNAVTRIMARAAGIDNRKKTRHRGATGGPSARSPPSSSRGKPSRTPYSRGPIDSRNHHKPRQAFNDQNRRAPRRKFDDRNHCPIRSLGSSQQVPTKKKKVVKPKHLKRKLENAENDETREKLQHEMKEFVSRKEALSTKKIRETPKRQKTTSSTVTERHTAVAASATFFPDDTNGGPTKNETILRSTDQNVADAQPVYEKETQAATPTLVNEKTNHEEKSHVLINDSDSESDVSLAEEDVKRQRGRRRRGRKGAAAAPTNDRKDQSSNEQDDETPQPPEEIPSVGLENASIEQESTSSINKTKSDERRCIGRKPVTDFVVGKRYDGTVVYMKPFGVFIDVGCHSDAFCHISRVQDDYVKSPENVLKVGEKVSARIVEIDRPKKRLTVSLQSDARWADEQMSSKAKKQRTEKKKHKKQEPEKSSEANPEDENQSMKNRAVNYRKDSVTTPTTDTTGLPLDEALMTPAELKRSRKLARRAERRAQKELTGISA